MPCATLMMSSTPKTSVSPAAISAYTPPPSIPAAMAWPISCAISAPRCCAPVRSARPAGLGVKDCHRAGGSGRKHLDELAVLPLEDERQCLDVLAEAVELHCALDGGQRDVAMQVRDEFRADQAAGRLDRRRGDLADRVGLGHVGVDVGGSAAVLGDILLHHGLAG